MAKMMIIWLKSRRLLMENLQLLLPIISLKRLPPGRRYSETCQFWKDQLQSPCISVLVWCYSCWRTSQVMLFTSKNIGLSSWARQPESKTENKVMLVFFNRVWKFLSCTDAGIWISLGQFHFGPLKAVSREVCLRLNYKFNCIVCTELTELNLNWLHTL